MIEYKEFYCPTEKLPRSFKRVDNGIPVVGEYQCEGCEDVFKEFRLHEKGIAGVIKDNILKIREMGVIEND